ncbi:MAG: hypothetical protein ABIK82_16565 [Pseudomonadota bacterium]
MKPASSSDNASGLPLSRLLASAALKGRRRNHPALRRTLTRRTPNAGRLFDDGVFWRRQWNRGERKSFQHLPRRHHLFRYIQPEWTIDVQALFVAAMPVYSAILTGCSSSLVRHT